MSKKKKEPTPRAIKLLWGRSGNKCASCQAAITEEGKGGAPFPVGVMAHIEGENPGAARHNPKMTVEARADYANLILVCPTCHTKIDNDVVEFTVDKLIGIKKDHEKCGDKEGHTPFS